MDSLGETLSLAFRGGERRRRELRLTEAEAGEIARRYSAQVRDLGDGWYEIEFGGVEYGET